MKCNGSIRAGVKIAREARESRCPRSLDRWLQSGRSVWACKASPSRAPQENRLLFPRTGAGPWKNAGVDLFILETFTYIEEILLAIDAIRSFSLLPVIAQLTLPPKKGVAYGDLRPTDAAAQLKK